ncbi:MAG: 50S ribosomal protein L10 [Candidatus Micrarchaeia archaeon]
MTKKKLKSVHAKKESVSIAAKKENVIAITKIAGNFPNVALLNIRNLPDRILQKSKKQLRGKADFVVAKNSTLIRAIAASKKGKDLAEQINFPTALVYTSLSPYQLFKFFKDNKANVAAKPGMIAPFDIVVPEGETDLMPGPALSELKGAGINAQIKGGKIIIAKDSVVAKKGAKISDNVCKALQKLNILPFEAMVNMVAAYDGKFTYTGSVLDIDEHQLNADLVECLSQSFNVSFNASFPTSQNIDALLSSAFAQGRNMAINGCIYSAASTELLLTQSVLLGNTLGSKVGNLESQSNAPAAASTAGAPAEQKQ